MIETLPSHTLSHWPPQSSGNLSPCRDLQCYCRGSALFSQSPLRLHPVDERTATERASLRLFNLRRWRCSSCRSVWHQSATLLQFHVLHIGLEQGCSTISPADQYIGVIVTRTKYASPSISVAFNTDRAVHGLLYCFENLAIFTRQSVKMFIFGME
jgi:hypothetical protein